MRRLVKLHLPYLFVKGPNERARDLSDGDAGHRAEYSAGLLATRETNS